MDRAAKERLLRETCTLVLDQGGDAEAVEAILEDRYSGDDLEDALMMALVPLYAWEAPGGPAFVRGMRDDLPEPEPARPRRRRWRVA